MRARTTNRESFSALLRQAGDDPRVPRTRAWYWSKVRLAIVAALVAGLGPPVIAGAISDVQDDWAGKWDRINDDWCGSNRPEPVTSYYGPPPGPFPDGSR
jgi:hypothetical protein